MLFLNSSIFKILKKIIQVLLIIVLVMPTSSTYAQSGIKDQNTSSTKDNRISSKTISGLVTSVDLPLINANIIVKNTDRGTKTNDKGFYTINATKGERLEFTYVGMKPVEIIIEDITKVLNIEMTPIVNNLKEVTVKGKRIRKDDLGPMNKPHTLTTSFGDINTEKAGYSIHYIKGEDLNIGAISIVDALLGRISNFRVGQDKDGNTGIILRSTNSINLNNFAIWDVDGLIYKYPPPIDLINVKDVYVIKSLAGTVKYGSAGAGGVIVVRTKVASFDAVEAALKKDDFTNKE
mgnify:CR=1 FL=1